MAKIQDDDDGGILMPILVSLLVVVGIGTAGLFGLIGYIGHTSAQNQYESSSAGDTSQVRSQAPVQSQQQAQNGYVDDLGGKSTSSQPQNNGEYYFRDNVLQAEDVKINIERYSVIPVGETGNEYGDSPVIAFWYTVTNLSEKEIDPSSAWIPMFTAIQDNNPNSINELSIGMLPDPAFLESQSEQIKQGGTVENAIAYELDDLTTPVTLKARRGMFGEELGEQDYPIEGMSSQDSPKSKDTETDKNLQNQSFPNKPSGASANPQAPNSSSNAGAGAQQPDINIAPSSPTTEKPQTAQKNSGNSNSGRTIYITPTGKRYHYDNSCNGGTYIESTLEEAQRLGLTPCDKCVN